MLIGREAEIATFEQVLAERKPTLIVVTSEPRMGKSTLLQEFGRRAKEQGWCVIGEVLAADSKSKVLGVDRDTTEQSFNTAISMPLAEEPASVGTRDQSTNVAPSSGEVVGEATDVVFTGLPATNPTYLSKLNISQQNVVQDRRRKPPSGGPPGQSAEVREEIHKPTVILIDRYHPKAEFETWFTKTYIADLKQSESSIVVVVAAYPVDVGKLAKLANRKISLGPIPKRVIRQHLRQLNNDIALKMKKDEVEAYAAALSKEPGLISSLTRLLQLESSASASG